MAMSYNLENALWVDIGALLEHHLQRNVGLKLRLAHSAGNAHSSECAYRNEALSRGFLPPPVLDGVAESPLLGRGALLGLRLENCHERRSTWPNMSQNILEDEIARP